MSALTSIGTHAAQQAQAPKPLNPKPPAKEEDNGPGAAALRHVPATSAVTGGINLLV
jgi:hypothetical protein